MDYKIELDRLSYVSSSFSDDVSGISSLSSEFSSSSISNAGSSEISNLVSDIDESFNRLNNAYNNCNSYLSDYINEFNTLEEGLASFSGNLESPLEFQGEFEPLFDKVVFPSLQTGGDKSISLDDIIPFHNLQATDLLEYSEAAYNGDKEAMKKVIEMVAPLAQAASRETGIPASVLISQSILETGWFTFPSRNNGGMKPENNNVLGMNDYILKEGTNSDGDIIDGVYWDGKTSYDIVPQSDASGNWTSGQEHMCAFNNVDECYHDYAVFTSRRTPNLVNPSDVYQAVNENLSHYATDPSYTSKVNSLIRNNNLTQYDKVYT